MKIFKYIIILIVAMLVSCSAAITGGKKIGFERISIILGMDIEKLLRDSVKYKGTDLKSRTTLYLTQMNFSSPKGVKEDYLLKASIKADWWKNNTTLIIAFTKGNNVCRPVFYWDGSNKSFNANPKLIDIDSDRQMEILIEEDYSGNQSTATQVDIWRYNGYEFVSIFSEGLDEGYTSCPYGTSNSYSFIKNKRNPKLLDIYFIVQTGIDMPGKSIREYWSDKQKNLQLPKPFYGRYVFSFNGTVYVSDMEVYDYREFFRKFFADQ